MAPGKIPSDRGAERAGNLLILGSVIVLGAFCLFVGMCLAVASTVAQFGRLIGGIVNALVGAPFLAVFATFCWIAVACLESLTAFACGEIAWLFLAMLGLLVAANVP